MGGRRTNNVRRPLIDPSWASILPEDLEPGDLCVDVHPAFAKRDVALVYLGSYFGRSYGFKDGKRYHFHQFMAADGSIKTWDFTLEGRQYTGQSGVFLMQECPGDDDR
jgi:hypothetical protein